MRLVGFSSAPTSRTNPISVSSSKTRRAFAAMPWAHSIHNFFMPVTTPSGGKDLCARFPEPTGDPKGWTRSQQVHGWYHHPDYFCPEPYGDYPSHLHIDLLPRAQHRGYGRRMLEQVMDKLQQRGSPGAHLGVSVPNSTAFGFYQRLGFRELIRVGGENDGVIYMGKSFRI